MVNLINIIQDNYEYILIVAGIIIEGYAILTSNDDEKKTGWLIISIILITIGCIIRAVKALD